jgi:glutamate synthase domain-containing protein 3
MADLELVTDTTDRAILKSLIEEYSQRTGSATAREMLQNWDRTVSQFKKIMPRDYRRVLEARRQANNLEVAHHG